MHSISGNDLNLGILPGGGATLQFPRTMRDKHLYVCGGTGTGKSKFLENAIRQDIIASRKSKCGLLLIDPHGSLYDSLIQWLAWNKIDRPIVPIDLRQDDWIVSYNVLRQRKHADPQVLIDNLTEAIAHVWGQSGVDQTPRFARWVGNVLRPLYEKNLTLVEAEHLIDLIGGHLRYLLTSDVASKPTRQDWAFAEALNERDFDTQIGSTVNRLRPFIMNERMRATFGLRDVSLDLGTALEEGQIILVNLATQGAKISEEDSKLFATLLLSDLWTAAKERGKPSDGGHQKPFYVYIDEFQNVVTPTIAKNLDQARGFGLHLTLANQFPRQILTSGPHGQQVYDSIMENASSKVVFRLTHEDNLIPMAKWLFMGVMNPDEIKLKLYSTKVMGYREEMRDIHTEGSASGGSSGAGFGGTENFFGDDTSSTPLSTSESWSSFSSGSHSESESVSHVPMLIPILGKELSSMQYRSLEEQLFRAMAVLFDQQERHAVARLVGMRAPVSIRTPEVSKQPGSRERTAKYLETRYQAFPFALRGPDAQARLRAWADSLHQDLIDRAPEPITAKRRIRPPA